MRNEENIGHIARSEHVFFKFITNRRNINSNLSSINGKKKCMQISN